VGALEILGQAIEIFRIQFERADITGDVVVELLAERDELFAQRFDARPRGLVLVDAGAAEITDRLLDVVTGGGIGAVQLERGHAIVNRSIERQLGQRFVDVTLALGHRRSHRLVGMDAARQSGPRRGVGKQRHGGVEVVEAGAQIGCGIGRLEARGAFARLVDISTARSAERLRRHHQLLRRAREQFRRRRAGKEGHSHDQCNKRQVA
jgi:hypothetical protein